MSNKLLDAWFKSMVLVNGWYAARNDFIAGLLYPVLIVYYVLWASITAVLVMVLLLCMFACLPFKGINGLGYMAKSIAFDTHDLFVEMTESETES